MSIQPKQLAQAREATANAVSIYSPASGVTGIIQHITICNTETTTYNFSLFKDDDGTTYDKTTSLFYDQPIPAKSTFCWSGKMCMNNSSGNLAYQSSTGNTLTITVDGYEVDAS